jgi:hypothetical protein
MVESLRALLSRHAAEIPLENSLVEQLYFSKFFHGRDSREGKVLFLVSDGKKLIALIKMMREARYNDRLVHEHDAQIEMSKTLTSAFRPPRVYFSDTLDGLFVYAEEVVPGSVVGKDMMESCVRDIFAYQKLLPQEGIVDSSKVAAILGKFISAIPQAKIFYDELLAASGPLFGSRHQHGDLTYMNIMREDHNGAIRLIDWNAYGERVVWGADFCHYVARIKPDSTPAQFKMMLSEVIERHNVDMDKEYMTRAYIVDEILDLLQKNNRDLYYACISEIKAANLFV